MPSPEDRVQESITDFWSEVAPGYEDHRGNVPQRDSPEYKAWVSEIKGLLPAAPADVLDIATGTGFLALIVAALGHRVTGIDLSEAMLDEARARADNRGLAVSFLREDAVAPQLAEASFDAITSRHFIWTLREPERAFRNWLSLLRPGGRLIAIDGFWFPPGSAEEPDDGPPELFMRHYTPETQAALPAMHLTEVQPIVRMLEDAGFNEITVRGLDAVHELAENPPAAEPWYVIVARRPN